MSFTLRPLARESIPRALEKAERYRLLNEPFLAESICLDILLVEPDHQPAVVTYLLAQLDQFNGPGRQGGFQQALATVQRLKGDYEQAYYSGLVEERRGLADIQQGHMGSRATAWAHLQKAMDHYKRALTLHPPGNDDATLRWNTCVRVLEAHHLTADDAADDHRLE